MFDRRAYHQAYHKRPDVKARVKAWRQDPVVKAHLRAYRMAPTRHAKRMAYQKEYIRKIRLEVLAAYGGKCKCCGETEAAFLSIDHVNGDGAKDRRVRHGPSFYHYLRRHHPEHVQVLCYNCNMAKAFAGECPHQTAKEE